MVLLLFFHGCFGKPCDKAAWTMSILTMGAKGKNQAAGGFFLDIEKFYDNVVHDFCMAAMVEAEFPRRLMALALASYQGWRALETCDSTSIPFEVGGLWSQDAPLQQRWLGSCCGNRSRRPMASPCTCSCGTLSTTWT